MFVIILTYEHIFRRLRRILWCDAWVFHRRDGIRERAYFKI